MVLKIKIEIDQYPLTMTRYGNWVHLYDAETGIGEWRWWPVGLECYPRSKAIKQFLEMTKHMAATA